jgi:hypothetical protein
MATATQGASRKREIVSRLGSQGIRPSHSKPQ